MNLRKTVFWRLDQFKGRPLKKILQYTKDILEIKNDAWVETRNKEHLEKLLRHAKTTTLFYSDKDYKTLQDFPVVNKNLIRDNFDAFFSSKFKKNKCKLVSTSGSTGAPFSLYQNKEKVLKVRADNLYFSSKSNFELGGFLVFIRIWPKVISFKLRLNFYLKNFSPWNILNLSDDAIAEFITKLNRQKTDISFLGYPTAFEKICRYIDGLDENPIKFKTKSIITISEALNAYTKSKTETYFGVTPLARYSNNETGIIAQQINSINARYRINDSSYVIEVFDLEKDEVLPFGKLGRIVLTDLFNYATPLIRYDTGDVGIMELDDLKKPYFTEISGRIVDQLYDTSGNLIPSHLSLRLMDYGKLKQFQLVQKDEKTYQINLNTDQYIDEAKLILDYKHYFGSDAIIQIRYVDEIPLLASGKRREVLNEFYK